MVRAATYASLALRWRPGDGQENNFLIFSVLLLAVFLIAGVVINQIPIPEEEKETIYEVPERVAKFILERPKPKPKPVPKAEAPKPKPKSKPQVKKREKTKEIKLTKKQKEARKNAADSGLLALSRELADLVDTSSLDSMVGKKIITSGKTNQASAVNTDILTQQASSKQLNPDAGQQLDGVGKTRLSSQQQAVARSLIDSRVAKSSNSIKNSSTSQKNRVGANYRSEEDIAYVMDRNKSKLHNLYRQARRKTPGLKGKIVLEITILPSGKVSKVRIKSSELNDAKLESRLVARIKQFDFGNSSAKTVTVTFPVEFLPS